MSMLSGLSLVGVVAFLNANHAAQSETWFSPVVVAIVALAFGSALVMIALWRSERRVLALVALAAIKLHCLQIIPSHPIATAHSRSAGISLMDAMVGQFCDVFAHEMGRAMFDVLGVPVMGREEDAADNFATYLMLRFGDEESRALIIGAAYSYNKYVQGSQVTVPLAAFSDAHSAPAQRFYNLLCTAYGSDPTRYGDFVEKAPVAA